MSSPDWGKKHTCLECGTAFYDMQRSPMACPKCGARHEPVVLLKSDGRQMRKSRARRPVPALAAESAEPASGMNETETAEDEGEVLDVDDEAETEAETEAEADDHTDGQER